MGQFSALHLQNTAVSFVSCLVCQVSGRRDRVIRVPVCPLGALSPPHVQPSNRSPTGSENGFVKIPGIQVGCCHAVTKITQTDNGHGRRQTVSLADSSCPSEGVEACFLLRHPRWCCPRQNGLAQLKG